MFKSSIVLIFLAIFCFKANAQNRQLAQKTIDTLASKSFYGRGYINGGDKKAALYIAQQFRNIGIKPLKKYEYFQPFSFWVNTFPGKCEVNAMNKILVPGKDYIVDPACPSINKWRLTLGGPNQTERDLNDKRGIVVYDTNYKMKKGEAELSSNYNRIFLQKKLTWSVSTTQNRNASIHILDSTWNYLEHLGGFYTIKVKVKAKFVEHQAYNVIGYIEGTEVKDTFILLTAHYDHLGMMGKTMFPGANDNASGVAMMLDMAAYFTKNPCKYSIAFMAFAGEEAGLIGSKHYTDNPWPELPLGKIKFLINMDLMGSGEKGMAVVNATIFPEYFNKLKAVNDSNKYLSGFKLRGKAANSDHYWFVERGVKGFFFYLMGDFNHYHDINDNRDNLKLGEFYDKSFLLIRDFIKLI